jgi:hypothetical protein
MRWYYPSTPAGQELDQALRAGVVPGLHSCVAAALHELDPSEGAVCWPALLQGTVRQLKARAPGLADIPQTARYADVATMMLSLDATRLPGVTYDKSISAAVSHASGLNLAFIYEHHRHHCAACHARGPFSTAVLGEHGNPDNPCYVAILLSLLDGKYPLPLQRVARPFDHAHYACFDDARRLCPEAVGPPLEEMRRTVLRELGPGDPLPLQIHPALVVVKDSEVLAALHALEDVTRPFCEDVQVRVGDKSALLGILTHLDALNRHLAAVAAEFADAPHVTHTFKKIKLRICTDLGEWNDLLPDVKFAYPSVADAVAMLLEGYSMAKADAKNMFWSFPTAVEEQHLLGVRLDGRVYVATRAQFGGKLYPLIANALMGEITAILRAEGIPNVIYTDDLFTAGTGDAAPLGPARCSARFARSKVVIAGTGLVINEAKDVGPVQTLPFLGVVVDMPRRRLFLPEEKLRYYLMVVQALQARRPTKKDLEHAVGLLNWAATVMPAGRVHIPRIRACITRKWGGPLACLTPGALADLAWWERRLQAALQAPDDTWAPFWFSEVPVCARVIHDSSGDEAQGFGVMVDGKVYQGRWAYTGQEHSSAYRELVPILLAAQLVCDNHPSGEKVLIVTTDNESMAYAINKGSCKSADSDCLPLLEALFDLAERHQLFILADWIPRELNQPMDDVSKDKEI